MSKIKLSHQTINILENFSKINSTMILKNGSIDITEPLHRNLTGIYECDEYELYIDGDIGIETGVFCNILKVYPDYDVELNGNVIKVSMTGNEKECINYVTPYKNHIIVAKTIGRELFEKEDTSLTKFIFDESILNNINLISKSIGADELTLESEEGRVYFEILNSKSGSTSRVNVDATSSEPFNISIGIGTLGKLVPSPYNVTVKRLTIGKDKKMDMAKFSSMEYNNSNGRLYYLLK